jgi:hypothetical protein
VQKAAKIKKETYDRLFFTVVLSNCYDITEIMLKVALNTITTIQESKTGRIRNYIVLDLSTENKKTNACIY